MNRNSTLFCSGKRIENDMPETSEEKEEIKFVNKKKGIFKLYIYVQKLLFWRDEINGEKETLGEEALSNNAYTPRGLLFDFVAGFTKKQQQPHIVRSDLRVLVISLFSFPSAAGALTVSIAGWTTVIIWA